MRKLLAVDLLILDDFALDALDPTERRDLYEALTERHCAGSIIVTSNRGPDEWLVTLPTTIRSGSNSQATPKERARRFEPAAGSGGSCRIEIPRQDLAGIDQPPVERPDTGIRRTSC